MFYRDSGLRLNNHGRNSNERAVALRDWEVTNSVAIADEGSRYFSINACTFYRGLNPFPFSVFDTSGTDTFTSGYYNGASWVFTGSQSEIDVTNYNNIASGLSAITAGQFKSDWVYVLPATGDVYVIFGQEDDTKSVIELSEAPTNIPTFLQSFGVLIGRIIIEQGVAAFDEIQMLKSHVFTPTSVINHSETGGIGADDHHDQAHALDHVDGTDDIRDATNALKGLATATHITSIEGAVQESDYNATTFMYATSDNTPQPKTPNEVLGILGIGANIEAPNTATLTVAQVKNTFITNRGQSAENTTTLPTAAEGMKFTATAITTGQGAWHLKADTSDLIVLDGTALNDADKVSLATPAAYNEIKFYTIQTGSSDWNWMAETIRGTWTDGGA